MSYSLNGTGAKERERERCDDVKENIVFNNRSFSSCLSKTVNSFLEKSCPRPTLQIEIKEREKKNYTQSEEFQVASLNHFDF